MIRPIITAFLVVVSLPALSSDWMYYSKADEFSDDQSYFAVIQEIIRNPWVFPEDLTASDFETYSFGIRCDKKSGGRATHAVTVRVHEPLAFYNSEIKIQFKANDDKYTLYGRMFSDSMESGYAYVRESSQLQAIVDSLSKGNDVLFVVSPVGVGESVRQTLTLRGSSKAISQLLINCPVE